jgi:predicted anti-sigma-YlaC factor YlaD
MISQKHEDNMQQGGLRAPPVEEKQATTVSEGRSRHTPASPPRWIVVLLSIIGIALPLVAGSMASWPWGLGGIPLNEWILAIVVPVVVPVTIGACLLCFAFRTWWVAVFAGVAWIVGEFLAAVVRPLAVGGWPELQATQGYFWWLQGIYIGPMLVPLLLSMALVVFGVFALDALGKRSVSRQMEPLLRVVAIVVSLLGGIAAEYLVVLSFTPYPEFGFGNPSADRLAYLQLLGLLLVGLVGLGGAVLFRSWWAILVVPLVLSLGAVLTCYLSNQIVPDLLGYDDVGLGVFAYSLIIIPFIAVIGALIGSYLGTRWKKRQQL